ncbi:uncharacterized protein UV8b_04854 [Ustilaginoidea virens]|uniref:Cupin-type protein n=1 Tax=Ustilaginoidea virens TaxID=1159556 RepID=A0A8E5MHK3_USTVR|nr:uncharacterized protein UV8b_04854 [Ustilaginoidea virens]QUC20613.1 hypothetical protein UV8b_04854 [Ustilaginoidea virens]
MSGHATNAWLRSQRKSDLSDLADSVGMRNYESLKKSELEVALDDFIAERSGRLAHRPDLAPYFSSRSKALGSPIKKERDSRDEMERSLRVGRRRITRSAEDQTSESDERAPSTAPSTAVTRTPARQASSSQAAARIALPALPATPADVAEAIDRSAVAVRQRVASMYHETGITEASHATRDTLSTVTSILFVVSAFELWFIRPAILANRYAWTVPAIPALGTSDRPVYLPDMFLLLSPSFWSPALTWALTSAVLPTLAGYFFNLSATSRPGPPRTRARTAAAAAARSDTVVDPLTFSIAKALATYVVYAQGVTFGGLPSETAVARLDAAVYGGWRGVLVGCAIVAVTSIYDAVLNK